ncbi:uncharacterized protein LOC135819585 [Sycon ciliatum]|uniref:uncharacterized protein LOC135819585 n=1 Tax=Sycon ciliatum TaxID=27933 RepID=UPI0031F649BB
MLSEVWEFVSETFYYIYSAAVFGIFSVLLATLGLFALYKLVGFQSVGAAGVTLVKDFYTTVNEKRRRLRIFSKPGGATYAECWDKVNLQPLLLIEWLHANCPDHWHTWVAKAVRKELNELLIKQSAEKKVAWKISLDGMSSGSCMPAVNDTQLRYEGNSRDTLVITAELNLWSLDGVAPLVFLCTCMGQYKGSVSQVQAGVTVRKLQMKVQLRISPYKPLDSKAGSVPRFSYELTTVKLHALSTTPQLLSGALLHKNEEVKLKAFLTSAFEKVLELCNVKLVPPQPESSRYSNQLLEEQLASLSKVRPLSRSQTSLNQQPIGGGMSLDLLPKQLVVEVVEGHRLCRKGKDYSDSFCTLEVDSPDQKPQNTTIVRKATSPEWNEAFVFDLGDESTCLTVSVHHHDVIRKNEFLGRAKLMLNNVTDEKGLTKTLFLEGRSVEGDIDPQTGSVTIRVQRKSIPRLSRIKRFKSTPSVAVSSQSLREFKRSSGTKPLDLNQSAPAVSLSNASTPGSPENNESPRGRLLGRMLAAEFANRTRSESPAINVESPSDGTEDEHVTVTRASEGSAVSRQAKHSVTYEMDGVESVEGGGGDDDQTDYSAPASNGIARHGQHSPRHHHRPRPLSADMAMSTGDLLGFSDGSTADRMSSASGMSGVPHDFSTLVIETDDDPPRHFLIPSGASKRTLPVKGQKLHIYNNHVFVATRFSARQEASRRCAACAKEITGFGKQGYRCRDCGLACHKKCHCFVDSACPRSSVSSMKLIYWEMPL